TLDDTALTQPALFAFEWSLATLWKSWGVEPAVVMGHSLGEYVAACVAGMFAVEDGLRLAAVRGPLMASRSGGAMIAVAADESRTRRVVESCGGAVDVAAINGPESVVLSGDANAVASVTSALSANGIRWKRLVVSAAFHSREMDPILDELEREVS